MKLTFHKTNIVSFIFFVLFILICVLYYIACNYFFIDFKQLFNYVNNDHDVYLVNIQNIEEGNVLLSINNDFGIALLYTYIIKLFNLIGIYDIILIPFIFNIITVVFIYINYIKICEKLNLTGITKYYFFLGFQILYFTQLINKDLLTLLFFILVLKWMLDKRYRLIIVFSALFFLVRIQLLIFGILCVYLSFGNFKKRIFYAYIGTSIIGAIISVKGELITDETMGSGFSSFLIHFNQNYFYTGYLIFNPLRILQFFMDIYMSLYIYTDGLIDVSKILRIPLLLAFLFFINPFIYSIRKFSLVNSTIIKQVYIILISFTLTWLMNPTINARYVMLIVPFLLILCRYIDINKKEFTAINFNNKVL